MTKAEKINKLAGAVKDYRGTTTIDGNHWIRTPKPKAWRRIERWLTELGRDPAQERATIDAFKHRDEMDAWLRGMA